jgi:hypothetical protein
MFIPRYWSESSHREILPGRRQVTIRRFGWSSQSQADAEVHARQRVEEAWAALREGGSEALRDLRRRERVVAYSGSDGLPIREEILEEHEDLDVVLTRNSYGAVCLNTTRAMFVDVDRPVPGGCTAGCLGAIAGFLATLVVLIREFEFDWIPTVGNSLLAAIVAGTLVTLVAGKIQSRAPRIRDPLARTIRRIEQWCEERRDWRVAVYETPAGVRTLPVHAAFDASDEATYEFMDHVGADPLYVRMCRLQKCFRARVSPKPWRAGIRERFRAGGTWPVRDPDKLARREAWVREYDRVTSDFASCRLVDTIGRGRSDPNIERIRHLHDERSGAESRREIA